MPTWIITTSVFIYLLKTMLINPLNLHWKIITDDIYVDRKSWRTLHYLAKKVCIVRQSCIPVIQAYKDPQWHYSLTTLWWHNWIGTLLDGCSLIKPSVLIGVFWKLFGFNCSWGRMCEWVMVMLRVVVSIVYREHEEIPWTA